MGVYEWWQEKEKDKEVKKCKGDKEGKEIKKI